MNHALFAASAKEQFGCFKKFSPAYYLACASFVNPRAAKKHGFYCLVTWTMFCKFLCAIPHHPAK